jgi:S-DNA-T family DNA segregation ATPase FtsK/SpoIIIE
VREEDDSSSPADTLRDFIGITLVVAGLFLFVALATHCAADWGCKTYPSELLVSNRGGRVGAWLSYNLFVAFGICSYLVAFFLVFWGIQISLRRQVKVMPLKMFATVLVLLSLCTLASQQTGADFSNSSLYASMPSLGGVYGASLARVLVPHFGTIGSHLVLLLVASLSLLLSTDWLLVTGVVCIWNTSVRAAAGASALAIRLRAQLGRASRYKKTIAAASASKPPASHAACVEDKISPTYSSSTQSLLPAASWTVTETALTRPAPTAVRAQPSSEHTRWQEEPEAEAASTYELPPLDLLEMPEPVVSPNEEQEIQERMAIIEETLRSFEVEARVVAYEKGPVLTKYELELAPGIRVHKIISMADDLAIALKAPSVRIIAPIPGKSAIGIEVPNAFKNTVRLRELIELNGEEWGCFTLPLCLGKDAAGMPIVRDLSDMPHLLIAGTTGSGKSVCLNSIILSLLYARTPDDLKLILIDPKMVELSAFKDIPHLISPVITEMKKAATILEWLVRHMEERYDLFSRAGVKKIESYNALGAKKIRERLMEEGEEPPLVAVRLPHIIVVIDELADLMMVASKEVETAITRISQKSRAVGIHLVVATQRPSVDVLTGLIKSNMPVRVAFKVASKVDSRTIIDRNGADKLLGRGDMLLLLHGMTDLVRAQCALVTDREVKDVVSFLKEQATPQFEAELLDIGDEIDLGAEEKDELFDDAARIVLETQRGSVSLLQRKLEVGYGRAARLIDMMAKAGLVGEYKGSKAREVLMSLEDWEASQASNQNDPGAS